MKSVPIATIVILSLPVAAFAAVPQQINHQGMVRVNGVPFGT